MIECSGEVFHRKMEQAEKEPEMAVITHGHWVKLQLRPNTYKCSYCLEDVYYLHSDMCDYNYCPNCGACMDE